MQRNKNDHKKPSRVLKNLKTTKTNKLFCSSNLAHAHSARTARAKSGDTRSRNFIVIIIIIVINSSTIHHGEDGSTP